MGCHLAHDKAQLYRKSIVYLGMQIDGDKVSVLQSRRAYIAAIPMPTTKAQLASLLGVLSFCQQHIDSYQVLVSFLAPILHIKAVFRLTDKHRDMIKYFDN